MPRGEEGRGKREASDVGRREVSGEPGERNFGIHVAASGRTHDSTNATVLGRSCARGCHEPLPTSCTYLGTYL